MGQMAKYTRLLTRLEGLPTLATTLLFARDESR